MGLRGEARRAGAGGPAVSVGLSSLVVGSSCGAAPCQPLPLQSPLTPQLLLLVQQTSGKTLNHLNMNGDCKTISSMNDRIQVLKEPR